MAKRFEKNVDYLSVLCKCDPKLRPAIIEQADQQLIKVICDCIENILSGNVSIPPESKKKLSRHKRLLRELRSKNSLKFKKKKLIQSGGFLPALLGPLLGVVGGLVTDLIFKR